MSVCIHMMGGLSNTMFQYAFGRALESRGKKVVFKKLNLLPASDAPHALNAPQYGLDAYNTKIVFGEPEGPEICESDMPFRPELFNVPDTCSLIGHYQSEKYFLDIADQIRKEFTLKVLPPADLMKKMRQGSTVAMHVRRGDYVGLQDYHGLMSSSYYEDAFNLIDSKHPHSQFYIFSDDPGWCREHMPYGDVIETGNRYWDLHLMSLCQHAVIANSSFSWWSSWLGDNKKNRTVIAPRNWFKVQHLDSRDIVPKRWHLLGEPSADKCVVTVGIGTRQDVGKPGEQEIIGQKFSANITRFVSQMRANSPDTKVMTFNEVLPDGSPTHQEKPYAFKIWAIEEACRQGYKKIIWADSSVIAIRSLDIIWNLLDRQGYWFSINGPNVVNEWCSDAALKILDINRAQAYTMPMLISTAFGLNFDHPDAVLFFDEYKRLSQTDAFIGPWTNEHNQVSHEPDVLGHRHDQTAASVIAWRLNLKLTKEPAIFLADKPKLDVLQDYKTCCFFIERNGRPVDQIDGLFPPYLESLHPDKTYQPPISSLPLGIVTKRMSDEELANRQASAKRFRESQRRR